MKYFIIAILSATLLYSEEIPAYKSYRCFPIHKAIIDGKLDEVKKIIEKDNSLLRKLTAKKKYTPLCLATRFGHINIVKYLISKGVHPNEKGEKTRMFPLYLSVLSENTEIIDYLLSKGADINLTSGEVRKDIGVLYPGRTALGFASINGNLKLVKYLVSKGANVNIHYYDGTDTALDEAANDEIKKYLISKGAKTSDQIKKMKKNSRKKSTK